MLGHMAILQNHHHHHHHKYIQFKSTCEHRPKLCFFGIDVCAAAFFLSYNNNNNNNNNNTETVVMG